MGVDDLQIEFKSLPQQQTTTSGTSDPRTSTTLVLFEEFVPLEYREQLAVPYSSRRRLPSLFSQSKPKIWKPAPTLNGRPYVVGHVPRSPSYRELEFEGLLNRATPTKVLTLDSKGPPRASIMAALQAPGIPSSPIPTKAPGISAPLYVAPAAPGDVGHLNAPMMLPGPKSDENHTDSTKSSSTPLSQKRSSRFRLPVPISSPGGRRTGLTPSEYSTVDFETRLASYSDDEFNSGIAEPEAVKQKRRESKDDAWVDILVGAHARRMGGQDAQLKEGRRRGVRNRSSDPDISLEVAQVLAGVRERTPSSPSPSVHGLHRHQQLERVDRDPVGGLERFYNDQDVDEVEVVPRVSEARSEDDYMTDQSHSRDMHHPGGDADDEDEFEPPLSVAARLLATPVKQRGVGYFDLHPDRRPAVADVPRTSEDDLRDRLAYSEDSDDEKDVLPTPTPQSRFTVPPEPTMPPPVAPQYSTITSLEVQVEPKVNATQLGSPESAKSTPQSKTAALIEMYRERERNTPPKPSTPVHAPAPIPIPVLASIAPLQPSRLPVRSVSKELLVPLPPVPAVEVVAQPATPPEVVVEPVYEPPLKINFGETGRASPARYVHGAPLHNVLEEEEE